MAPKRKHEASSLPFVYLGAGTFGQHSVKDSPGYGKGHGSAVRTGIVILQSESDDGPLREVGFHDGPAYGWIAYNRINQHLYAAGGDGQLHAFRIADDGALEHVSQQCTLGKSVYVEIAPDGRHALVANYSAGVLAVLPLGADGLIEPATDSKLHRHIPVHDRLADRQEGAHPHQIRIAPAASGAGGRTFALACDLGADKVWVYEYDASRGALVGASNSRRHVAMPEGSGPRHLAFHPSGAYVYVTLELSGEVACCSWDRAEGTLVHVSSWSALPPGAAPCRAHHSGNAHVACSADGTRLYASTRHPNAVVTFGIDGATGALSQLQTVDTRGICPRHFDLSPSKLRVCNQDSASIVEFAISDDGTLLEPPAVTSVQGVCGQVLCEVAR